MITFDLILKNTPKFGRHAEERIKNKVAKERNQDFLQNIIITLVLMMSLT